MRGVGTISAALHFILLKTQLTGVRTYNSSMNTFTQKPKNNNEIRQPKPIYSLNNRAGV
jgi:hypothetical protein